MNKEFDTFFFLFSVVWSVHVLISSSRTWRSGRTTCCPQDSLGKNLLNWQLKSIVELTKKKQKQSLDFLVLMFCILAFNQFHCSGLIEAQFIHCDTCVCLVCCVAAFEIALFFFRDSMVVLMIMYRTLICSIFKMVCKCASSRGQSYWTLFYSG